MCCTKLTTCHQCTFDCCVEIFKYQDQVNCCNAQTEDLTTAVCHSQKNCVALWPHDNPATTTRLNLVGLSSFPF